MPNHDQRELSRVSAFLYASVIDLGASPQVTRPEFVVKEPEGVVEVRFTATDVSLTYVLVVEYNVWQLLDPDYNGFGVVLTPGLCRLV